MLNLLDETTAHEVPAVDAVALGDEQASRCRALWLAVIHAAVEDRHRDWFSTRGFHDIAMLAGVDPEYTRRKVLARLDAEALERTSRKMKFRAKGLRALRKKT
jgi:hypothetical protein